MTPQEVQQIIDPELFGHWLNQKPPEQIIGVQADACRCPIATYLQAHDVTDPIISLLTYVRSGEILKGIIGFDKHDGYPMPQELWKFACAIDEIPQTAPGQKENITAHQAQQIWAAVTQTENQPQPQSVAPCHSRESGKQAGTQGTI